MSSPAVQLPTVPVNLPQTYVAARNALAQCERVDECHEWANKAAAIAAYAAQANDESLKDLAARIQARAVRRCGELLAASGAPCQTAAQAGLSRLQRNQASAVARIPERKFERVVDGPSPPRVYQLAAMGVRRRRPSRTNNARVTDLRNEIKRLEKRRAALAVKIERTDAQIAQAKADLAEALR